MIDDEGGQLGILGIVEALAAAEQRGLDLVEVAPEAQPPVCRIMDYGKYKYQQSKRAAEAKKKQVKVELKEVKVRPKTEEHDFQFKLRHAERFMKEGNKAKVTMMFRGREMVNMDLEMKLLMRFAEGLKEMAHIQQQPKVEGRAMSMIVAPKK